MVYQQAIAYLYFDFYNGAMNAQQCQALTAVLQQIKQCPGIKVIVLMGGEDFWSNGIHLHCIEASAVPAQASLEMIHAINDLVLQIIDSPQHLTLSALRNNAGAGGAIMALACDQVLIRQGVVLNPHYQTMGLYGSEYWTYLLPRRTGQATSQAIMHGCQPMLACAAQRLGLADVVFDEDWTRYHQQLQDYCQGLNDPCVQQQWLRDKAQMRQQHERVQPLAAYREAELQRMRQIFADAHSEYPAKRRAFVYGALPQRQTAVAMA